MSRDTPNAEDIRPIGTLNSGQDNLLPAATARDAFRRLQCWLQRAFVLGTRQAG